MTTKKKANTTKRAPREDFNQAAFRIVNEATGDRKRKSGSGRKKAVSAGHKSSDR